VQDAKFDPIFEKM